MRENDAFRLISMICADSIVGYVAAAILAYWALDTIVQRVFG